jgi:hypothetical integral membrane protein (TIGR02206 family)
MGHWDTFARFGPLHGVAVAVCALLVLAVVQVGRRLARSGGEAAFRKSFAAFALCYWIVDVISLNRNGIDVYAGLPLHLCGFNALVAPFALLTLNRWLRATLYFWTFTLTLQAFIQPELQEGPAFAAFWAFWAGHTLIMTAAVYDLVVLGFRPDWRDLGRVVLVSLAYAAFIVPLNLVLGTNYGFIGNPPPGKSIPPFIDALGPWPARALIVMGLSVIGFWLALLPWRLLERRGEAEEIGLTSGKRQA